VLTILVTSGGSGVATAVLEASRACTSAVRVVTVTSDPSAVSAAPFDDLHVVPPTRETDRFQAAVAEVALRERAALVLAGRDDDVDPLAGLAPQLARVGSRWSGPERRFAQHARDKAWVAHTLRQAGLPAAETATSGISALALAAQSGFPLIVKPRRGDGSRGARLATNKADLLTAFNASGNEMIAQPFLKPLGRQLDLGPTRAGDLPQIDEYSAQLIVGADRISGPFVTRNALVDGIPLEAVAITRRSLTRLALRIADVLRPLGLQGPLNIQARETAPDTFEVFELNFRCTGLTGARAKMGFNEIALLLGAPPDSMSPTRAASLGLVARLENGYRIATVGAATEAPCASA
jgi:hypothetical protein